MNCSQELTSVVDILNVAFSVPTFIFGLVFNCAVFVALFCGRREGWTYMKTYITNLAIADTLVLFSLPVKIYAFHKTWTSWKEVCFLLVSAYFVNMYVSIFTVTAISVVRFIAIKFPFNARNILSSQKALVVCVAIWTIICISSYTFHHVDNVDENVTNFRCFQKISSRPFPTVFIVSLEVPGFLLPFIIMVYCSVQVILTLRKKAEAGQAKEKIQCLHIIFTNLVVFVVCFFPFHFAFLLKFIIQSSKSPSCESLSRAHNFVHISTFIANTSCCLDAFTYYFLTRDYWKTCCHRNNAII